MVEIDIRPIGGVVACGTLTIVVIWRCIKGVAADTVCQSGMVEGDICPVGGVMAGGALAIIVLWRGIIGMAADAVC